MNTPVTAATFAIDHGRRGQRYRPVVRLSGFGLACQIYAARRLKLPTGHRLRLRRTDTNTVYCQTPPRRQRTKRQHQGIF